MTRLISLTYAFVTIFSAVYSFYCNTKIAVKVVSLTDGRMFYNVVNIEGAMEKILGVQIVVLKDKGKGEPYSRRSICGVLISLS